MSKIGEIKNLSKLIQPHIGIITNIGEAHIENFKNIKGIAKAKAEIINSIKKNGTVIIGMPTLESQKYASFLSKIGHVNCKNKYELKMFLYNFFTNVYMFSMNDEVIHTGFDKMSNYIFAVCN